MAAIGAEAPRPHTRAACRRRCYERRERTQPKTIANVNFWIARRIRRDKKIQIKLSKNFFGTKSDLNRTCARSIAHRHVQTLKIVAFEAKKCEICKR